MITTIIKRDGTRQPYDAGKMTRWGRWAAETLGDRIDWPAVLVAVASELPQELTSAQLQKRLIDKLITQKSWPAYLMAGRLYAPLMRKEIYGTDVMPTIQQAQQLAVDAGFMRKLKFTDAEYAELESVIDHTLDFTYPHFQLEQLRRKYALRNRTKARTRTGRNEFETPQFVYMRMAMALAEARPAETRMKDAKAFYKYFSQNKLNPPTPNYVNLGTDRHGYASCCLYTATDDVRSLHAGDVIAYAMTYSSAGIGAYIDTRTVGDPVDGGRFPHQGRLRYYRAMSSGVVANSQAGRGGAGNVFYEIFNPQVDLISRLKNPRSPEDRKNRDIDFTALLNKRFARLVASNERMFLFTSFNAPDLHAAFFSGNSKIFDDLYAKYLADPTFQKRWTSARELAITLFREALETGRNYEAWIDEINRHTPYIDPIYSSNLCVEITQPTAPYQNIRQLYVDGPLAKTTLSVDASGEIYQLTEDSVKAVQVKTPEGLYEWKAWQNVSAGDQIEVQIGSVVTTAYVADIALQEKEPEVSLCSLGGAIVSNIHDDVEYADVMYYGYLMIDTCIHLSHYELPHVGYTAKRRLNAGMGIMDLATYMARRDLKYDTPDGKAEIHRVGERHMYYAIKASCRLARELGPAPWIHRTKWANGWQPRDTYNRNVDRIGTFEDVYDWDALRAEQIECGGGRFSSLVALMPGESSSKGAGVCNAIYPIRELAILKSDSTNLIYWAAPDGDILPFQSAWDISTRDLMECYALLQKHTDQAISADEYRRIGPGEMVPSSELIENFLTRAELGVKTRYYFNTHTSKAVKLQDGTVGEEIVENVNEGPNCGSGGCAL